MTGEEIAKRYCKFELCTHRTGEGICCLFSQDNCIFRRLEKENAELKKKLKEELKTVADKDLSFVAKFDALEKENADLKKQIEEYKNGNFVQTVNQIIEGKDKRLEQAKEHIRTLISCLIDWVQEGDKDYCYIADAEQFLKGENIILEDVQAGNSPFDADEVFNKEIKAYPEEKVK